MSRSFSKHVTVSLRLPPPTQGDQLCVQSLICTLCRVPRLFQHAVGLMTNQAMAYTHTLSEVLEGGSVDAQAIPLFVPCSERRWHCCWSLTVALYLILGCSCVDADVIENMAAVLRALETLLRTYDATSLPQEGRYWIVYG